MPNHTSDEHEWFKKSVNMTPGYEDYYVWHDGRMKNGTLEEPNNWVMMWKIADRENKKV